MNPEYDHPTNLLVPCQCGFKPIYYSIYYSRTPYDIWCPNCKKQLNHAKCKVTGHHNHAIDYWNNHLASLTKEQMDKEVKEFIEELEEIRKKNDWDTPKIYAYYWEKDKGPVLYQRW